MPTQRRPANKPRTTRVIETPPTSESAERPTKTTAPKPRRDVGLAWLVVLGLVVLAAVPLGIEIHRPAVWTPEEALSIAISSETLKRKDPISDADTSLQSWTPVYQGISRWDLPPAGTWLHQVAYMGHPVDANLPPTSRPDWALVTRGRIASAVMALVFVAGVFWAGHCIGGVTTGAVSALVAMTMPLVIGFGRHATPDSAALAWSTLSIAGALWAMRPLRASPSLGRQLVGWLVSGAALGLAALTAGPTALPATLLCTIALAMVCPRRVGHVMGILASSAVAALMLTPWVLHVLDHDANIYRAWMDELTPGAPGEGLASIFQRAGWRLSLAAALCGLWLIWLIPAVTQPFSTSTGKARRKMLLGWVWLVTAALLLAFAPGKADLAGLLLAAAPASVAIGLVVQQFHDLSAEARHARLWLICRWVTCAIMAALSIAVPATAFLTHAQPELVAWLPRLEQDLLRPMHWSFYAGTAVALTLASVLAFRFAIANHPGRTTACLALWMIILFSTAAIPASRGELLNTPANPPPESVARLDT